MKDDQFRSLSRMLEEYNRLVRPITEQIKIQDRWNKIASPILRVAELNKDILAGVSKFDLQLANQIGALVRPYQSLLDDMKAAESLKELASFAELVKPQIFIPGIAEDVKTPWMTDLKVISDMELAALPIYDTDFGKLCELEKAVAGLTSITSQFGQMNSIAAQIASLGQIDLTESWKQAIVPPGLIQGLNLFAQKQYLAIEKASEVEERIWRFGLIDSASKFVDRQVTWGTTLAMETGEDAPEAAALTPDFSELPILLSSAKRDDKDVEETFEKSQFAHIPENGKLLIRKAKHINDLCRLHGQKYIFPQNSLTEWAMILAGPFCRDVERINEVIHILRDMFDSKEVTDLIGKQSCFGGLVDCAQGEKKSTITKLQARLYNEFIKLEDKLISCLETVSVTSINEDVVSADVFKALQNVQKNRIYTGQRENTINDGIRDCLDMKYRLRDQTRQGESVSGKDAGEVDLMLYDNERPLALMEGLKLSSVDKTKISEHINKAMTNYNPIGCPLIYLLVYSTAQAFAEFWEHLFSYIKSFSFPYEISEEFYEINTNFTQSRHGKAVLVRNGEPVSVHLFAIAMK